MPRVVEYKIAIGIEYEPGRSPYKELEREVNRLIAVGFLSEASTMKAGSDPTDKPFTCIFRKRW